MEETVLVTYANAWDMIDDKTGERRVGLTVEYHVTDDLKPVRNSNGSCGYPCAKQSLPIEAANNVQDVPGIYKIGYGVKVQKGKPVLTAEKITYVGPVHVALKKVV